MSVVTRSKARDQASQEAIQPLSSSSSANTAVKSLAKKVTHSVVPGAATVSRAPKISHAVLVSPQHGKKESQEDDRVLSDAGNESPRSVSSNSTEDLGDDYRKDLSDEDEDLMDLPPAEEHDCSDCRDVEYSLDEDGEEKMFEERDRMDPRANPREREIYNLWHKSEPAVPYNRVTPALVAAVGIIGLVAVNYLFFQHTNQTLAETTRAYDRL